MYRRATVQLIVNGVYVTVPRERGFELLDRDRLLLTAGLTEQAELILEEQRRTMLHLLLGAGHLALIESPEPAWMSANDSTEEDQDVEAADAAELFIDFDAYGTAAPNSASRGVDRAVPGGPGE